MNCTTQNCVKACGMQVMDDLDRITFLVSAKCRTCFFYYLENLRLSTSPDQVCLSVRLNKQYCDLLLPYLDQKRKEARDSNKHRHQAIISAQNHASPTAQQRRRRLDFGDGTPTS